MSRSRLLLLLFVLLGLAVTYAWFATPRQQRLTDLSESSTDAQATAAGIKRATATAEVGLDFSGGEKLAYQQPKRDLFRPLYSEPVPVKKVVAVAPPPPPEPEVVIPMPVLTRPVALPNSSAKPIPPLKVLGYLQKGTTQTAFLSSVPGEIYVVKQGERFADNLLVRELNADKITVSRNLEDEGITLYFSKENARLKAAGPLASDRPSFIPIEMPQTDTINPQMPLQQEQPPNVIDETTVDP